MGGRYSNEKAERAARQMYETLVGMFELSQMIMGKIDQQSFGVGGGEGFGGGPGGPGGPGASRSAASWDPPTPGAMRSPGVLSGPGGGSGGGGPAGFNDSDSEEESMLTRRR